MLQEVWEANLAVVFVGTVVDEISDTLGFHHVHPRDRMWDLLEIGGITPKRLITKQERKALADGQKDGSLSDPVRSMFAEKKTSQFLKLGIGFAYLNRNVVVPGEKDKAARPSAEDVHRFVERAEQLRPGVLAFVTRVETFVEVFAGTHPGASEALGAQAVRIANCETWLLGSTSGLLRGEALTKQEDAFFALGERLAALKGTPA